MEVVEEKKPEEEEDEGLPEEVLKMTTDELVSRTRLIDNDIKVMRSEVLRIQHDLQVSKELPFTARKKKLSNSLFPTKLTYVVYCERFRNSARFFLIHVFLSPARPKRTRSRRTPRRSV